jgi:spartin
MAHTLRKVGCISRGLKLNFADIPIGSFIRSGGTTPYGSSSSTLHSQTTTPTPLAPPPKRRLLNRLLTSTDMLLTTLESSAYHLISHTTTSASAAMHHKYGEDMGNAVGTAGECLRNVGVVYIDARGVGRRALLKTAGKRVMKARMGGKDVIFQAQGEHGAVYSGAPPTNTTDNYRPPAYPPPGMDNKPDGYY